MSLVTNILPYIPQRAPFVMVDTLETCNEQGATTTFTVREDNIFMEKDRLSEPALIENIAQTGAARIGFICLQEKKPVPVGFIGAVLNLQIHGLPQTGDVLETSVVIKNQVFNATIVEGEIKTHNNLIAQCEMRIFLADT